MQKASGGMSLNMDLEMEVEESSTTMQREVLFEEPSSNAIEVTNDPLRKRHNKDSFAEFYGPLVPISGRWRQGR